MNKSEVELIQYNSVRCPECIGSDKFKTFTSCFDELVLKCLNCGAEYPTGKFSKSGNDIDTVTFSEDEATRWLENELGAKSHE